MTIAPEEIKACCATAYSSAAARFLLGDRFHPGGAALTSRLISALRVGPGRLVADIACGPGASALQLARETGCDVVGIDLSPASVAAATDAARSASLSDRVRFEVGDAEALPFADGSLDGVLSECALCTFPDKAAATRELARVLKPGGRVALSDMTAEASRLPAELTGLAAWVACVADARLLQEVAQLLAGAGLVVEETESHDDALRALLDRVEARLALAGMASVPGLELAVRSGERLIEAAHRAVEEGALGYGVVIARRP
jgi:SAM-dependent methyltransferase